MSKGDLEKFWSQVSLKTLNQRYQYGTKKPKKGVHRKTEAYLSFGIPWEIRENRLLNVVHVLVISRPGDTHHWIGEGAKVNQQSHYRP